MIPMSAVGESHARFGPDTLGTPDRRSHEQTIPVTREAEALLTLASQATHDAGRAAQRGQLPSVLVASDGIPGLSGLRRYPKRS